MDLAVTSVCCLLAVIVLRIRHSRRPAVRPGLTETALRLLQRGRRAAVTKLLDIGGFFGMDIGGSLTKLVFFMPDEDLVVRVINRVPEKQRALWHKRFAAVKAVSKFIMSREAYGKTGVRDARLSFHLPDLGGHFHFIRFETSRMIGALSLAKLHGLNNGMHSMNATGGGAVRVRCGAWIGEAQSL
jgi:hypothetical protein